MTSNGQMNGATKLRQPAALSPERAAKLELDQLRLVDEHIRPGLIGFPFLGGVIALVLAQWAPLRDVWTWFVFMNAASALCWVVAARFRNRPRSVEELDYWRNVFTASQIIFNVIWVAPPVLFWSYCDDMGKMFLILVYACNMAGGAAICAPHANFAAASIFSSAVAIIMPPLVEGSPFYLGIAALSAGFTFFMVHMARNVHITARDLLLIREDKNELIEQLAAAKFESDAARLRSEAASMAKSEFLANMSHELRTPLNAIIGFSEIMKNESFGPMGSAKYSSYACDIHYSGEHLLGLINDVLDLARIEAGRYSVRSVELDVRHVIDDCTRLLTVRASEGQVQLVPHVDAQLPLLLADERGMRQILLNLMSNAVKFTPPGGRVTVSAKQRGDGGMDLSVSDTGVGIDPEDVNAVFEAFGQGRHDITTKEKGTGLGLPIARGLVEAHGGTIALESSLGKGTTVICTFPRERLTAPQPVPIRLATVI